MEYKNGTIVAKYGEHLYYMVCGADERSKKWLVRLLDGMLIPFNKNIPLYFVAENLDSLYYNDEE